MLFGIKRKIKKFIKKRTYLEPLSRENILLVDRFSRLLDKVKPIPGAVAECGVYRGKTLSILTALAAMQGKAVYGFDSFQGLTWQDEQWFMDVSEEKTAAFLKENRFKNVVLVKGYFQDTLPQWKEKIGPISFLHLDCDLYESYKICLENLWPNLSPGGMALFDEYDAEQDKRVWTGPKKGIDEFCAKKRLTLRRDESSGKVYVVKPGADV